MFITLKYALKQYNIYIKLIYKCKLNFKPIYI